jgi:hypothetical protein
MYDSFRRLASEAYTGNGFLARDHDVQDQGTHFLRYFRAIPEMTEGFYATVAMTMTYFSFLEHLPVFALLPTEFDPARDSLSKFIGLRMPDKFTGVFDVAHDPEANRYDHYRDGRRRDGGSPRRLFSACVRSAQSSCSRRRSCGAPRVPEAEFHDELERLLRADPELEGRLTRRDAVRRLR